MSEYHSFQDRSVSEIESFVKEASYTSTLKTLSGRTEAGRTRLKEQIASVFRAKGKDNQISEEKHLAAMRKSREVTVLLVNLIERYASMTLSLELRSRLQRDNTEVLELERKRHALHEKIRELAKNSGILDKKILELIEMRVQDRLAEPEIERFSKKATEAASIPLRVNDDDLVFVGCRGSIACSGWRLPEPEERKNTYSLVYRFVYRPHDSSCYELGPGRNKVDLAENNMVQKDRIDYATEILKKTAQELESEAVSYSETHSHYCHDKNYPRDDMKAFTFNTLVIRCPKNIIDKVIEKLKVNSKVIKQN